MRFAIAAIAALMFVAPAHAADWWVAETDHFIVKSRDSEKETREFALELERYDEALRFLQNMPREEEGRISPANKVTIFRFGDTGDIAHIAGASGSGIAGFYIPRAGASVAFVPANEARRGGSIVRQNQKTALDGMSVLKHEYAHHFMMQYFPGTYPRWYVEGYAEMVATMKLFPEGGFQVGDPPQYRSYQVMRMSGFRLNEMLDANHELSGLDALQHYGTGWLLTHYLNFDDEGRDKLISYLKALAQGEDSLIAARTVFGDLGQLERELMSYRRKEFPGKRVTLTEYVPPKVIMRKLPADEVALMRQKMRLWRGVTRKEANDVFRDLRSAAASNPESEETNLLLAEAAFDAKDYDASIKAAEKAIELNPDSVRGWLYRGRAATMQAKEDPALADLARQYLTQAANLDRSDPRPLIEYYRTYLETGQPPTERAIIALETAYDRAGSDAEYRMLLGRQLLSENEFDTAKRILMPVAFQGHSTGEADAKEDDPTPRKLLTAINNKDAAGAIEIIDKFLDQDEDKDG